MIKESEVLQLLIDIYPPSRKLFVENANDWIPEKGENGFVSPYRLFFIISAYIKKDFVSGGYEHAQDLFDLIESFVKAGDENLSNAACTGFIEGLCNTASHGGEFEYDHFVKLLGKESSEFAKSWDSNVNIILNEKT